MNVWSCLRSEIHRLQVSRCIVTNVMYPVALCNEITECYAVHNISYFTHTSIAATCSQLGLVIGCY